MVINYFDILSLLRATYYFAITNPLLFPSPGSPRPSTPQWVHAWDLKKPVRAGHPHR